MPWGANTDQEGARREVEKIESRGKLEEEKAAQDGSPVGFLYAIIAVTFFSTSPVFIRWASPLTAFEITFGRMAVAALVLLGLAAFERSRIRSNIERSSDEPAPPNSSLFSLRFLLYGLTAALHFGLYIASLEYTSIAHSLALVYTAPVFVTIFTTLFLREPIRGRKWLGLPLVIIGVAVISGFEPELTEKTLFGDLLALLSAVFYGLYSVAGRRERLRHSLFSYTSRVYLAAALWLLPPALLFGKVSQITVTPLMALSVLALGLLPLAAGHTLYNAALRKIHPTYANLVATQEVTGGVLLGFLILGETPSAESLVGAALSLIGVIAVLLL